MGTPDPRKQRLIRLAMWVVCCAVLDLLLLGLYFVLFDWFASSYMRMHEWKSLGASLNKTMAWRIVFWKGSSGIVFISSTVCASLTMTPFIVFFATSKKLLLLDFSMSLFFIHIVLIWNVSGLPTSWQWWVLKLSALALQLLGTRFLVSQLVRPLRRADLQAAPVQRMSHIV